MDILNAYEDGIHYFGFVGQFDTTDVEQFQAHVEEAVDAQHFKIVINLGQMTFINSTALGSLIRAQKRLNQYGGDLAVAELHGFAESVFKTLGIDRKIKCFPDEAEAVKYLKTVGSEGVTVEGEQQVAFTFVAPEQAGVAGSEPRMGLMRSISEQGLSFVWENLDGLDTEALFAPDTRLKLRFQLPLFHETHTFSPDVTVTHSSMSGQGKVTVQLRFDQLSGPEARAVEQYVKDLRYLKGELS